MKKSFGKFDSEIGWKMEQINNVPSHERPLGTVALFLGPGNFIVHFSSLIVHGSVLSVLCSRMARAVLD